jgi:DNA-binding response OmpR family regulator
MTKPLVFIIEDDNKIRKIMTIALQNDFEVEAFEDGHAALEQLHTMIPAIIFLDLNLPKLPGEDILLKIRSIDSLKEIPIIIATADYLQASALRNYAEMVLVKPISPIQLLELTKNICGI